MKIWIITDTHFNHEKLKTMGKGRPDNYEEKIMEGLKAIKPGDVLIHLGDFCIGKDEEFHKKFMDSLSGVIKYLIRGNHDNKSYSWYLSHGWNWVGEIMQGRYYGKEVLFSHMPIFRKKFWETYYEPAINIHGHLHGMINRHSELVKSDPKWNYDVAPDIHDYKPLLLENILRKI